MMSDEPTTSRIVTAHVCTVFVLPLKVKPVVVMWQTGDVILSREEQTGVG